YSCSTFPDRRPSPRAPRPSVSPRRSWPSAASSSSACRSTAAEIRLRDEPFGRHAADAGPFGTHPRRGIDLILERASSAAGPQPDRSRKLALIIEGGGMRGVVSAGSLLALDLLGFREVFDEIYATSAGAVNAAYFLSGQGKLGMTIYFDDIANRRFINPWRLLKIVDVDYAYDRVISLHKPLDDVAIRASRVRFLLSVTDARSGLN